ncbi:MAG TPA: hypothetical protein VNO30_35400 [Kofleriaceae bacterium]|nr:hypothetical protein [Kofleriaceae bacterium]
MTPEERAEIVGSVATLQGQLEALVVRGVRAVGGDDLKQLTALHEDLGRIGAGYLGGRIGELIGHARTGDPKAAAALCGAQTALRVFDRVLTLHAARELLAAAEDEDGEDGEDGEASDGDSDDGGGGAAGAAATAAAPPPAPVKLDDRAELLPMLAELTATVESLIATGLSTASAATRQKLDVSFKEASKRKLLRLGASLRYVNEELGRFVADASAFSPKRFAFFLHRSWLLARGLHEAIRQGDAPWIARLLMSREPEVVRRVDAIVMGVGKRVQADGGCSFEFRMRSVGDGGALPAGTPIVWSCVFPPKKGVPAEAYLHLPQPQKFAPKILLDRAIYTISECAISRGEPGGGVRLMLGPKSTVTAGKRFTDWAAHLPTDWTAIRARAAAHRPSPLELEVELQEAVVLHDWQVGAPDARDDDKVAYPITAGGRELVVMTAKGPGDAELVAALDAFRKQAGKAGKAASSAKAAKAKPAKAAQPAPSRGPLFGLMHYERCQLVLQPLAIFGDDGPEYLTISKDKISVSSLVSSLDFRA